MLRKWRQTAVFPPCQHPQARTAGAVVASERPSVGQPQLALAHADPQAGIAKAKRPTCSALTGRSDDGANFSGPRSKPQIGL